VPNQTVRDMKRFLSASSDALDKAIRVLYYLAAALLVFIAIAITSDVALRYLFNKPLIWVFEATEYALLFITFMAAAYVLKEEGHVKLDLVLNALGTKLSTAVNTLTSVIMALVCLVMLWYSAKHTLYLYQNDVMIIKYYTIPQVTVFFIIPVGFLLLLVQSLKRAYQFLKQLR
jgi:C4-dicarboxylate transporter, DctQ subunit